MGTAAWIALGFFLVAVVASLTFVGVRGLTLWRAFRSFSRTAETALDSGHARRRDRRGALRRRSPRTRQRLTRATEHLQISLAQLAVLRAAAAEANAAVKRLRSVVPSK